MTGRPREFDLEDRLDRAMRVFWRHGYEGTSLADLTSAMGINRPSLYAAYGNKESLFRQCLDRYGEGPASHVRAAMAEPTARATAEHLLRGVIAVTTRDEGPGCLLIQSALTTSAQSEPVRAEVRARRLASQEMLLARFERAREEGEFAPEVDVLDLARYISTVSYGLAVQAANGTDAAALNRTVDLAFRAWPD
ncbi:TetR/AcrR family transcriptional regulator [Kitasatospora sp. NPDC006697]|uniref:TetR/AcrR family transcriptional regulator n=1 Tax=Kitasatospora sp. NPDC006697 TaxID=3364020 RepID=UPI00368A809F